MVNTQGFEALRYPYKPLPSPDVIFTPHPAYEEYLKIHKILVGPKTAQQLIGIYEQLRNSDMPRYKNVAGWAATEAALAMVKGSEHERLSLLDTAQLAWSEAIELQQSYNASDKEHLIDHAAPFRYALDIAHLPLLAGVITKDVADSIRQGVAHDVLNIAEANNVQLALAKQAGDTSAIAEHVGLAHEANALLGYHSLNSPSMFAIPSFARADSGHHYPEQTHDLIVIQQSWGVIEDITPVEIKATASSRDRGRYNALLMRGKMHLAIEGKFTPDHTLNAFGAYFRGDQSPSDKKITDHVRGTIMSMYWLYKQGPQLGALAASRSLSRYRDAKAVHGRYPEIAPGNRSVIRAA